MSADRCFSAGQPEMMEPRKCFAREAKRLQFVEKSQRLSRIHSIAEESRAIWETVVGESWRNAEAATQKPTKSLKSLALPRGFANEDRKTLKLLTFYAISQPVV